MKTDSSHMQLMLLFSFIIDSKKVLKSQRRLFQVAKEVQAYLVSFQYSSNPPNILFNTLPTIYMQYFISR